MEDKLRIQCSFELFHCMLEPNIYADYTYSYDDATGVLTLSKETAEFLIRKFSEEIEFFNTLLVWLESLQKDG